MGFHKANESDTWGTDGIGRRASHQHGRLWQKKHTDVYTGEFPRRAIIRLLMDSERDP